MTGTRLLENMPNGLWHISSKNHQTSQRREQDEPFYNFNYIDEFMFIVMQDIIPELFITFNANREYIFSICIYGRNCYGNFR